MAEKLGILGRKLGMTRIFDDDGVVVPVTVILAGPCPIVQVKDPSRDGYHALQIGFEEVSDKHLCKAQRGHLAKSGDARLRILREVRLENSSEFSVGQNVTVELFEPGEFVKIIGRSIGKGFQGGMKRWNFKGSSASHGAEKDHRSLGSTGSHTFPGRVFKNKKMPGHMGDERVTVHNIQILEVRPEENLLLVKGSVPGPRNGLVMVSKQ